jgi:hypothetical protein
MKAAIAGGEFLGPRMYIGPSVVGLPVNLIAPVDQLTNAVAPYFAVDLGPSMVTGCEDARAFVRSAHEQGADFIKTNLALSLESFDCIIALASELGLPVKGHISDEVRAEHYINSGAEVQHSTELFPFLSQESIYDQPARHEDDLLLVDQNLPVLVDMMTENDMPFAPTLITPVWSFDQYEDLEGTLARPEYQYYSPQVMQMLSTPETNVFYIIAGIGFAEADYRDKIRVFGPEFVKALFDGGVMLLAGTDSAIDGGPVYGYSLHDELQIFVEAGLTPYEALQTATVNSAIAMDEEDEWGTIEVGKRADLVLLNANPLDDIKNSEDIAGVMVRGQWLSADALQQRLDEIVASYDVIELEPYTSDELGISGVAPAGWNELEPGVFARGNPASDPTFLAQLAAPVAARDDLIGGVLGNFGIGSLPDAPADSFPAENLTWDIYVIPGEVVVGLAVAETDAMVYVVAISAAPDEFDGLAEQLLVPALMAFTPAE